MNPISERFVEFRGSTTIREKGQPREVTYVKRYDPLFGYQASISEERSKRDANLGVMTKVDIKPKSGCQFCRYESETPEGKVYHSSGAVSFSNKYPWEAYQWVTAYPPFKDGGHKVLLSAMDFQDLERLMESENDLAVALYNMQSEDPSIIGMTDFTNWGPYAGASKQHPHSQRQAITHMLDPEEAHEIQQCLSFYRKYGINPFDTLITEELERGERIIFNNDSLYVGASFAPRRPYEIIIIPKAPFANIIETSSPHDRDFIRAALGVFPALRFYRGVSDLNIAVHMAPFTMLKAAGAPANKFYRWHMHILPRKSVDVPPVDIGGAELGYGINVSTVMPETLAREIRQWYQEHPNEELIIPELREEFHMVTNGQLVHV